MSTWALTLAYTLHMAATVVWIGGLFFHAVILTPVLQSRPSAQEAPALLEALRRRFEPLTWLSLTVLVASGLTQMAAHPKYQGFLAIGDRWAAALLAKHLAVGLMVLLAGYQSWVLQPRLVRLSLLRAKAADAPTDQAVALQRRLRTLSLLNLLLSLLVLALTAVARTA